MSSWAAIVGTKVPHSPPKPALTPTSHKQVVVPTLLQYVFTTYPAPERDRNMKSLYDDLTSADTQGTLNNWKDFALVVSKNCEKHEVDMSVYKSSTWAVCQEFLGTLNHEEKEYAEWRGGIWSMNMKEGDVIIVQVRDILTDLKKRYPVKREHPCMYVK